MATNSDDNIIRIWCGPDAPPRGKKSRFARILNSIPPNENVYIKPWNISDKLVQNLSATCNDILEIAAYIYSVDQSKTRGGNTFPQNGKNWYRQFELHLPVRCPDIWNRPQVHEKLTELLRFMANDNYQFTFRKLDGDLPIDLYFEFDEGQPWFKPDSILLFSGGLDSLTGVVEELQDSNRKIMLVSHRPVSKIAKYQRDIVAEVKRKFDAHNRLLHIPVWINKDKGITKDANQRSRSFLYASIAAVIASMTNIQEIKFYENGIVSCNLPISDQVKEARASRSTHLKSLRLMSELFSAIFECEYKVSNPFLGMTKSDVVRKLVDRNAQELIPISHSCTRTMGSTRFHTHCGTCSQCIERRLATLHNGLEDFDPEEMYRNRLFLDKLDKKEDRMMTESYIQHARLLEELDIDDFFEHFTDGFGLIEETGLPAEKAANLLYDLHHRHGCQVATVINSQIKLHAEKIRKGEIADNSLLEMVVGTKGLRKQTKDPSKLFPTTPGVEWKDITIDIMSNDSIRVKTSEFKERYTGYEIGFTDRRRGDRLNKQWELLTMFAENNGALNWDMIGSRRPTQKRIQELNQTLKSFFGLKENPIAPYTKRDGWVARFKISDKSYGKS